MLSLWIVADCLFSTVLYGYVSALQAVIDRSKRDGNTGNVIPS